MKKVLNEYASSRYKDLVYLVHHLKPDNVRKMYQKIVSSDSDKAGFTGA